MSYMRTTYDNFTAAEILAIVEELGRAQAALQTVHGDMVAADIEQLRLPSAKEIKRSLKGVQRFARGALVAMAEEKL